VLPSSVITGAVIGGIWGLANASNVGIRGFSGLAGFATPYLIFGALIGFILHLLFFRK
jgi:hypothetical protein